jgi:hypothetical protein
MDDEQLAAGGGGGFENCNKMKFSKFCLCENCYELLLYY